MRFGPFLKKNSTLYLTSPSFGCTTTPYKERLHMAISHYLDKKINVIKGPFIESSNGLLSSSPSDLAKDFINAYITSDMIQSVGGGEVMISILPYIDFDKIKKLPPKFFMGYSDNTILTFLLPTLCDVASIYGGNTPEFGSEKLIEYQKDQLDLMFGKALKFNGYKMYEKESLKDDNPYASLNLTELSKISSYKNQNTSIEGRIIGGCIDVVSTLVGTMYDNIYEFNNKYSDIIWFFESCDMTSIEVYRRLLQMKYAGWFKNAKAFLFGRPLNNEVMFDKDYKSYVINALKDLDKEIIFDLDIGHVKPQIPIIVGSTCTIKINDNKYQIKYELK